MHQRCLRRLFAVLLMMAPASLTSAADFELVRIADGIHAAIRREPPGLTFVSNTVFVINDDDVVVVDTGVGAATARDLIAALKTLTPKPVRYVINTHWHDDHMMGNAAFRAVFPGVEFIGHSSATAELMSTGAANRRQLLEQGPAFAQQIRDSVGKGKNLAGEPISHEERIAYLSDVAWAERYFAEAPGFSVIAPTLTVTDRMTLVRGDRRIDIRFLGRAHTASDLVVHLPKENVVITGDLVVWPVPLFGSTSFPVDYIATLENLLALKPAVLVPGHGPLMRDDTYMRQMLAVLKSIETQVRAAVARGETAEQARKRIDLAPFREAFSAGSALRAMLFNSYVAIPGVDRAWQQITGKL